MNFAKRVFQISGFYGIIVLAPQLFLEKRMSLDFPPPLTHPEYFYGFLGVALAWQVLFLLISTDPVRYRPLMIVSILEKLGFGPAAIVLYLQGRLPGLVLAFGVLDLVLGAFFLAAYIKTPNRTVP